jgi:hypothetical protein
MFIVVSFASDKHLGFANIGCRDLQENATAGRKLDTSRATVVFLSVVI